MARCDTAIKPGQAFGMDAPFILEGIRCKSLWAGTKLLQGASESKDKNDGS